MLTVWPNFTLPTRRTNRPASLSTLLEFCFFSLVFLSVSFFPSQFLHFFCRYFCCCCFFFSKFSVNFHFFYLIFVVFFGFFLCVFSRFPNFFATVPEGLFGPSCTSQVRPLCDRKLVFSPKNETLSSVFSLNF